MVKPPSEIGFIFFNRIDDDLWSLHLYFRISSFEVGNVKSLTLLLEPAVLLSRFEFLKYSLVLVFYFINDPSLKLPWLPLLNGFLNWTVSPVIEGVLIMIELPWFDKTLGCWIDPCPEIANVEICWIGFSKYYCFKIVL